MLLPCLAALFHEGPPFNSPVILSQQLSHSLFQSSFPRYVRYSHGSHPSLWSIVKMRLINTTTLELVEFQGQVPSYAILSHTWGEDEACLQDWKNTQTKGVLQIAYSTLLPRNSSLPPPIIQEDPPVGYWKILEACVRARSDDFDWIWADTTNIDKTSSSELSEAINSMYAWYRNADVCYAYLADVPAGVTDEDCWKLNSAFRASRWFKRGWTLQEMGNWE